MWGWGGGRKDGIVHTSQSADNSTYQSSANLSSPPPTRQLHAHKSWRKAVSNNNSNNSNAKPRRPKSNPLVGKRRFRMGNQNQNAAALSALHNLKMLPSSGAATLPEGIEVTLSRDEYNGSSCVSVSEAEYHTRRDDESNDDDDDSDDEPYYVRRNRTDSRKGTPSSNRTAKSRTSTATSNPKSPLRPTRGKSGRRAVATVPTIEVGGGVWSLREHVTDLRRMHRAQFKMERTRVPTVPTPEPPAFQKRNHRIPIPGAAMPGQKSLFDEVLLMMRPKRRLGGAGSPNSVLLQVPDELASVQEELHYMDQELDAIRQDQLQVSRTVATPARNATATTNPTSNNLHWDVHRQLQSLTALVSSSLLPLRGAASSQGTFTGTAAQKGIMQAQRGLGLTVSLRNPRAHEMLLSKCGCKQTAIRNAVSSANKNRNALVTTIRPDMARDAGVSTIQHVVLLPSSSSSATFNNNNKSGTTKTSEATTSASDSSFLLSRDEGKSFYWGRLPDRLFRRIKNTGVRSGSKTTAADIVYLATGPLGCYYAEFRSGESWWGMVDDDDFDTICAAWDVYRVVFGPSTFLKTGPGRRYLAPCWIIISRDGRVAWKNLPTRLHTLLASRMASQAAPLDVSLGYGGAYFVRFGDGTVHYQLPVQQAKACRELMAFQQQQQQHKKEENPSVLLSMSLHPEMPHDFVIRHAA